MGYRRPIRVPCDAMGLAHWDDVEAVRYAKGEMDARWQTLGDAAGTAGVGVNRVRVAPGRLSTPPHSHGASEELFYVLAGSGLAWQDENVHELRAGDCVIHLPDGMEHTFVAGPEGLDYLVFGTRHPPSWAGCRARARSASAGRGRRAATTTPGTSRRPGRRSPTATPPRVRPTSSTSTRPSRSTPASG